MSTPISTYAHAYVDRWGLAVLPLPPYSKKAATDDWPNQAITDADKARDYWTSHPNANLGVVLAPSRLCSLDVDNGDETRMVLEAIGLDLDELIRTHPTIRGKDGGCRIEFRVPDGAKLSTHRLRWPDRDNPATKHVVLELRAGDVQDVFPPSMHPDTRRPYVWITKPSDCGNEFPVLPAVLLDLWQSWDSFKETAIRLCPWAPIEERKTLPTVTPMGPQPGGSVIAEWNRTHDLHTELERYGYKRVKDRYLSPHSKSGDPGVWLQSDGKCWITHGSDPLCSDDTGRPVNPFDLFLEYDHHGDMTAAVRAAAKELGMDKQSRTNPRPALAVVNADGSVTKPAPEPDADACIISEHQLAMAFSAAHPDLRYVAAWGRWYEWDGVAWREDRTLKSYNYARDVCVRESADASLPPAQVKKIRSAQTRAAVENLARSDRRHAATSDQWDADPWLLNTPAGIIVLRTGTVRPARPEDHQTKCTNTAMDGSGCPTWLRFLATATNNDQSLIDFMQRMAGYSLTGDVREHALFFVYGTGGNGKGTFLNTLAWILGDYAKVASMETFTESKNDRHPQELASLLGRRLVSAQETEEGKRWAESRIKTLTGGDPITARFMRQDEFTFMPQFKLIIAGNHKPGLRNVDEAIKRRLHLIPFTVTVPPEERDPGLMDKLRQEAPGILRWCVDGCLAWQKLGLAAPDVVKVATDEYLSSNDVFQQWVDECCKTANGFSATPSALHKSYKAWAEDRGEYVMAQTKFSQLLESRGFHQKKIGSARRVYGITLVSVSD